MAKSEAQKAPEYFVRESRIFKGKELHAGSKFDPAAVDCSQAEADTWYRQGLLMTAAEMSAAVELQAGPASPDLQLPA